LKFQPFASLKAPGNRGFFNKQKRGKIMKLFFEAILKFALGLLMVGLLVFLPAGTFYYPGAWLLLCLLFGPMLIAGFVMLFKSPDFLKKRLDAKEKRSAQKGVIKFSGLMFVAGFVVSGLDFRFGWSYVSKPVLIVSSVLFLLAYALYAEVMRENAYLSRTIGVEEGQKVVDTGLYGIVRHPMYMATLLLFLMIPLILGSWYALIPFAFYPVIIVMRLKDEEALLARELPGYREYQQKVKFRLIPFIW
jgi:protein-S-isoprenylcysteine O-methyltransferase Ste14